MRVFFFLVVLANLLLFFWETGYRQPPTDDEQASKALVLPGLREPIVLLGEMPPAPVSPVSVTAPVVQPVKPVSSKLPAGSSTPSTNNRCLEIGPYANTAEAVELQQLLQPHAAGITIMSRPQNQSDSWWVLIPKAENMTVAKERRQMLLDKGIKDFWLFNKGELQGAISLGLHERREEAEAAQRQFTEKGIVSEIVPRSTRSESHWLHIPWNRPPLAMEEVIQTLKMQNAELKIPAPTACR